MNAVGHASFIENDILSSGNYSDTVVVSQAPNVCGSVSGLWIVLHARIGQCYGLCRDTLIAQMLLITQRQAIQRAASALSTFLQGFNKDTWCRTAEGGTGETIEAPVPHLRALSQGMTRVSSSNFIQPASCQIPSFRGAKVQGYQPVFSYVSWNLCSAVLAKIRLSSEGPSASWAVLAEFTSSDVGLTPLFSCWLLAKGCSRTSIVALPTSSSQQDCLLSSRRAARVCHLPVPAFYKAQTVSSGPPG